MNITSSDSIKKRYVFSLVVNILLFFPRILNASIVPRSLGPLAYGDFQFLINNFLSIKNFLDLGTSTAFFTYNAKNDEPSTLNFQYLMWWGIQLALIILFVASIYLLGSHTHVWPGQNIANILLASVSVWLFVFAQQLIQFGDSKGLTVLCQKTNLIANIIAAGLLIFIYFQGLLTIKTAMLIYITGPIIVILFLMVMLYNKYFFASGYIFKDFSKNYAYFKNYCAPLITFTLVAFLADFFDRWMLQKFAGSTSQGYYSLSYNWAAIALIFFNPLLNIFWREVSQFVVNKQKEKIGELFTKFAKLMFVITAFISVFLAFNAKELLLLIAGKKFEGALIAFVTMIFYPLVQVYGQLASCIYFSMEKISLYRNLGIWLAVAFTTTTYFVLAPSYYYLPGLGCGADGFSLKILLTNLIGTDIIVYFACKMNDVKYLNLIYHRLITLLILFFSIFCSHNIADFFYFNTSIFFNLILKVSLYITIVSLIFDTFYGLLGLYEKPSLAIKKYFKNHN